MELTYIYTVENRLRAVYDADELLVAMSYDGDGNRIFHLNYNLHTDDDWRGNSGNGNGNNNDNSGRGNSGNNGNANGNTNNTGGRQNQSGILFPIEGEVSEPEQEMIDMIKTTGKHKNYELIEYVNDVNREHAEMLMELNVNGIMDTAYSYGNDRLTDERFTGWIGYYTYDPRGSVSGVTDSEGMIWQSYRYDVFGNIIDPLTLNRYSYVKISPLNYVDPSGHYSLSLAARKMIQASSDGSRDEEILELQGTPKWRMEFAVFVRDR